MREDARAVVIGAGICGSSIAYHLGQLGWKEVVVLDRGPLAGGTTSHAPGLVGQYRSNPSLLRLLMYSVGLYRELELDGQPGYFQVGSLRLASSKARLEELRRQLGVARAIGLEARLLTAGETRRLFPFMNAKGVLGALHIPSDGSAKAPVLAGALARRAEAAGATFHARVRVKGFEVLAGHLVSVETDAGRIKTQTAVIACGIWSPEVGRLAGVTIPLLPFQHQYVATSPLADLEGRPVLPNLRDPDKLVYTRQDGTRLVLGGYERDPAPFEAPEAPSGDDPTVRPFDPKRFASLKKAAQERIPLLREARFEKKLNGLESFTPDGEFILGETPAVRGLFVACGFCAHGVSGSGGVGRAIAEWIVDGRPSLDLSAMDIARFGPHAKSRRYVRDRAREVYSTYYDIAYPGHQHKAARGLRLSPVYGHLRRLGAVFGEKAGWERANWFRPNERLAKGRGWPEPRGWARRSWSPAIGAEHEAAREKVAIFDESSFSKIEVSRGGALTFLEDLCPNLMDRPKGSVTYTPLLNHRGGFEGDVTVTRLEDDRFLIVSGTAAGPRDLAWLRAHLETARHAQVRDLTSSLACFALSGPRSRDLLKAVAEEDVSDAVLPYRRAREVVAAGVPILALRISYTGELGYELYAQTEYAARLWEALWEAGKPLGLLAGGYRALDSLRLEKGYRVLGAELDAEHNPFHAGLGFAVKLGKDEKFLGREALERAQKEPPGRRLACLTLDDPSAVVIGGEPILDRESVAGRVTSGGYGYTVKRSIAYGYLPRDSSVIGTRLAIELIGKRCAATVSEEPLYDPKGERLLG